ncbi:MAG: galactokinase [Bacteroidetes bacterium]|nr:galactokinase [Bacteroidota bacterium]
MMDPSKLITQFDNYFEKDKYLPKVFFAPGRVNLIGEHTDYNGGKVFPMAIDAGTYMVIRANSSDKINFASTNYEFNASVQVDNLKKIKDGVWVNYPLGIVNEFVKNGVEIKGFDVLYSGNIPPAAGLSSSASIEMVTAFALNEIFSAEYDRMELVKLCKKSENEFIGVNCGIMDMFAVGFGKENNAIALDCATLEFNYAPLELNNLQLIVSNTNKERGLADSKYNERVSECNQAVQIVRRSKEINNLSELSLKDFREIEHLFSNPVIKRRAYHIVSENYRVEESLKALKNNDLNMFGNLLNASHVSLRDNYEVTGLELDSLVNASLEVEGVIGSRMTGAGFGGCTISLVDKDCLDDFYKKVTKEYKFKTGRTPLFYLFKPSEGVRELPID